jgi:hypothetical protein
VIYFFLASLLLAGCGEPPGLPLGSRAGDCTPCHTEAAEGWASSRHGQSAASPVFQALLPRVEASWGGASRERCVACHAPGHGGDEAVGCVSCHAAVGNRGEANGALIVDLDAPLAGPSHGAAPTPAHRTTRRAFLTSASLCGTCHEVHGPALLEEPTLSEFRASPFAAGDSCLDCHRGPAGARHRFVGVEPPWGAPPERARQAAEEARALWAQALHLELLQRDGVSVARLTNRGAGHAVPTGVTFLRDVWVDAAWTDAAGRSFPEPRVLELGARLTRNGTPVALITDATDVTPQSLAPGETREVLLTPPPEATPPVRLAVTLKARAVRAAALSALALDDVAAQVPEFTVATAP